MLAKPITYFEQQAVLICDNKCCQAWGKSQRPTVEVDGVTLWIADGEQPAPNNPGTEEGGHVKPGGQDHFKLNKWCARECERSIIVQPGLSFQLPDWTHRKECPE